MAEQTYAPYCLHCEKEGHRTHECWSTHVVNARSNEINALSAPPPAGAQQAVASQWDQAIAKVTKAARAPDAWKDLFWSVALELNCLPSAFPDGNDHVLRQAKMLAVLAATPAPEAAPSAKEGEADRDFECELAEAESGPPLSGRWHHGNGVLVSGSIRIAQWDCDTNPPAEFRDRVLTWVCDSLNGALKGLTPVGGE